MPTNPNARQAADSSSAPGMESSPHRAGRYRGALCDLERLITTHLFCIPVNHSGSTFLEAALGTCRATWSLPREGWHSLGYAGPTILHEGLAGAFKIWTDHQLVKNGKQGQQPRVPVDPAPRQ